MGLKAPKFWYFAGLEDSSGLEKQAGINNRRDQLSVLFNRNIFQVITPVMVGTPKASKTENFWGMMKQDYFTSLSVTKSTVS